jgi:hypothetical protein
VARIEKKGAYRALVWKPGGNNPLERPKLKWEDNIKWILNKSVEGVEWIDLAHDMGEGWAVVNSVITSTVSAFCREHSTPNPQ